MLYADFSRLCMSGLSLCDLCLCYSILGSQFSDKYLLTVLTEWIHLRTCTGTGGFLASVQMMISASPIVESVLSVNDACCLLVVSLAERPVSIRRLVTVVPNSWWFPCNRQYVQSKPVIGDVQRSSVCTPPPSSSSFISPSSIQNSSYKYQLTASRTVRLSLSANNATNIYMICFFSAH